MRRTLPLACLALLGSLALTACGGEDAAPAVIPAPGPDPGPVTPPKEPPYGGTYPVFALQEAARHRLNPEFTRIDPTPAEEAQLRAQFGLEAQCAGSANPDCISAPAYGLQNIDVAHTAKLPDGRNVTGEGTLIAVVDNGYRTTHQELADKTLLRFLGDTPALGSDSHGTAVAAIAAGAADGRGMMGVAPGAALHLSSWAVVEDGDVPAHIAAATRDAAAHGAVVQNNSWGWQAEKAADAEARAFAGSGAADYAEHLTLRLGGTAAEWRRLFSAYDAFQETGVIVFANTNDRALGDASAWASLPNFVPQLGEAWIAVSNALFSIDGGTGSILEADLLSAPCGTAARFCLTADGSLVVPTAGHDSAYAPGTGTSYAAPQVSGAVALLAQAFPNLAPAERTARLLATARRDWPGFQASIAGETAFAQSVRRTYSRLYGHGVPDLKAALSPVGGLSIASGRTVFDGARSPLSQGLVAEAPIVGNAIARALAGKRIMAVDALGTGFHVPADLANSAHARRATFARTPPGQRLGQAFAFAASMSGEAADLAETGRAKLLFSHGFAGFGPVSAPAFSRLLAFGPDAHLQLSGAMDRLSGAARFTASRLASGGRFSSELAFSAGHDGPGGVFGAPSPGLPMATGGSGFAAASLTAGAG
ncbi:S8 family serine peptidase, partial [Nitratireductor pacificus]